MAVVKVLSPAKVNLMLRILAQRSDGYHALQSCFEVLPWGDEMIFFTEKSQQPSITICGFKTLALTDNIIYRAAELLKPFIQAPCVVHIKVNKKIPSGAGLGGGSSNAAATLKTLNTLWKCRLDATSLSALALKLGADVPFFMTGQSALVTGIGEHIRPMRFFSGYILLLFPPLAIATETVFNHPGLKRNQTPLPERLLRDSNFWINDCLPVVLSEFKEIKKLFDCCYPALRLRLSGTGSTLFALFDDKQTALKQQKMVSQYCRNRLLEI